MAPASITSDPLDHAIVGGGISGLYTAWRLLTDARQRGEPTPNVAIFEASARTGGRLLTWLPLGVPGFRAELGGMRFLQSQRLIWNLMLEGLGIPQDDVIPFPVEGDGLRLLLRGESRPMDAPQPGSRYEIPDQSVTGASIVQGAIDTVLGQNQAVLERYLGGQQPKTRQDWDTIKAHLEFGVPPRPLSDLGFWNLLSDLLSPEQYQYVFDSFGYYSLGANANAAEAMQFIALDFGGEPYWTLRQGYGAVPAALEEQVRELGGQVHLETRLASFDVQDDGSSVLCLQGPDGSYGTVAARNVVLGLPRRAIELLGPGRGFDVQGDPSLKRLITAVTPEPAFKFFLLYAERWWEQLGITVGRSVCDLPIRQTYYMPPDDPNSSPWGLLMVSYDDSREVDYWQGMIPPEDVLADRRDDLRAALAGVAEQAGADAPAPPPDMHLATEEMVRHATEQLALLHGIDPASIPAPMVGAFADWGLDPYGGGWNFWQPQVDVQGGMTRIKAPLGEGGNVFVVGDGYSGAPGWVEGALTATEATLQRHLGLAPPSSWLPGDYYLGW